MTNDRPPRKLIDLLGPVGRLFAEAQEEVDQRRREELELARLREREREAHAVALDGLLSGDESRRARYAAACQHYLSQSPPMDPTDERVAEYLDLNARTIRRWRSGWERVPKTS